MNQLQTTNKFVAIEKKYRDKLKENGFNDLQIGDKIWHDYYGFNLEILEIDEEGLHIKVQIEFTGNDDEKQVEEREHIIGWDEVRRRCIKMEQTYDDYYNEALDFFMNPEQYEIRQKLLTANSKEADTTAIMIKGNDVDLINSQSLLKKLTDKMQLLNSILENKKRQMENLRSEFMTKLQQINKVITILEIYMGIDEEIIQFKEGIKASIDEPLHFRQRLLYMEEEMADETIGGGADISNIEQFQDWVIKNYKILVPEEKCVVAMRPRRYKKEYGSRWLDMCMNNSENNFATFILIRNGENLYRIWTNKFQIIGRLFPKEDQFQKIKVRERVVFSDPDEYEMVEKYKEGYRDEEETKKAEEHFKFNVLMMQGLIDRTELFKPMKDKVNLFDPRTYGDSVKLVLDDELIIHTGRPSFKEYVRNLNKNIKRGSRIYLAFGSSGKKEYANRFKIYYDNEYNTPDAPPNGIYTIIETPKRWEWHGYKDENGGLYRNIEYNREELKIISYNPGGEIRNSWDRWDDGHQRKNKVRFYLEEWDTMFNYDELDLDDMDYYLNDRIERHDYLYMFPIVKDLKMIREKELEWEKSFVRLVKDRNKCSEELVWECVEWWKLKNIWKRPITKDDAKALRMIESRIKKLK